MKLLIVRHGESIDNRNGICQGQTEGKLSNKGVKQSILLAKELKKYPIDLIYCSPLNRAVETTNIIKKNFPKIDLNRDPRLTERNMGTMQRLKFPASYSPYDDYEGIEPFEDMFSRIYSFIQDRLCVFSQSTILIVSHGITITALTAMINNIPAKYIDSVPVPDNASLSEYYISNWGTIELIRYNSINHLYPK